MFLYFIGREGGKEGRGREGEGVGEREGGHESH